MLSRVRVFVTLWTVGTRLLRSGDFPNTGCEGKLGVALESLQGRGGSRGVLVLPGAGGAECPGGLARCLPRQLLQHECPRCPERPPFSLFGDLEQHMRKQHELFCCKLCLRHLQVSPPGCLPEPRLPEPCPSLREGTTEAKRDYVTEWSQLLSGRVRI